jgi:hypothetical protein
VSAIAATGQAASRITPLNEKLYHQSNLLGDWKGSFKQTHQPIEFKVLSINGDTAKVEYTHNGYTERGIATVSQNAITYNNVAIATRNGQQAGFEWSFKPQGQLAASGTQTAVLDKVAAPASDSNPLVGAWTGADVSHSISFQVTAINGRDAQVKYSIDGSSGQGVGDVTGNSVLLRNIQFASSGGGATGTVTFQSGKQTISLPVKRFTPKTA